MTHAHGIFYKISQEELTDDGSTLSNPPPAEETVDSSILAMEQDLRRIVASDSDINMLDTDTETLSDVCIAMESMIANGGMAMDALRLTQITVTNLTQRWPDVGLEDGNEPRHVSGIKQIGIYLKQFWKALLARMESFWDNINGWVVRTLSHAPRLKARAIQLHTRAGVVVRSGVVMPSGNIQDEAITRSLWLKGHVANEQVLLHGLDDIRLQSEFLLGNARGADLVRTMDVFIDIFERITHGQHENVLKVAQANMMKIFVSLSNGMRCNTFVGDDGDKRVYKTEEYLGSQCIRFRRDADRSRPTDFVSDRFTRAAARYSFSVTPFNEGPVTSQRGATVPPMRCTTMLSCLEAVIKLCDDIHAYQQDWNRRVEQHRRLKSVLAKRVNELEHIGDDQSRVDTVTAQGIARALFHCWRNYLTLDAEWITYCYKTIRGTMMYCDQSIKLYTGAP